VSRRVDRFDTCEEEDHVYIFPHAPPPEHGKNVWRHNPTQDSTVISQVSRAPWLIRELERIPLTLEFSLSFRLAFSKVSRAGGNIIRSGENFYLQYARSSQMVSLNPPLIYLEKRIAINIVKITRVDISLGTWGSGEAEISWG
jgi:hypothetical protein